MVSSFSYGADGKRFKQVKTQGSTVTTTYYVGSFEREVSVNGTIDKTYLGDHTLKMKAQVGSLGSLGNQAPLQHLLRDRLGSVDTLMDGNTGAVLQYRGYDVFGRPRDIASGNALLTAWQGVTKGYTDHEHLNEQQLIHMNGRIYDFNVGRFLSVDPLLQFPENSQSANPYSYILNNPMSGTDPSGYGTVRSGNASAWSVASCDSNHGNTCANTPVDKIMAQWGLSNGQSNASMAKQSQQSRQERAAVGKQNAANSGTSGVKEAGKHSKLFDKDKHSKYGTPSEPDPDELSFVKGNASKFEGSGKIESCALVCKSDSGEYSLSEIRNDNSHFACDTSPLSCSSGSTPVSDIHNHPPAGDYVATKSDVKMNSKLVEGQRYKVNPIGFSRSDLSVNFSFGINGWVTPSGTDKTLYFDSNMQYPFHLEYKNE